MSLIGWIDRSFYREFANNWDNLIFSQKVRECLERESVVLDLGAGAGIVLHLDFRGTARRICGVDLDQRVLENPYLDEACVGYAEAIPYPDNFFDVVFAANLLEHLREPLKVFKEVRRVLKPGGLFLFKTPNKWHYVTFLGSITPHGFHEYVARRKGRDNLDTFPTFYRANTSRTIKYIAKCSGFTLKEINLVEGRPEYMRITSATYLIGLIYERIVCKVKGFESFRIVIVGILQNNH